MKIAIIGAGITGLYLAWKLAERGHEVIVFEKRREIGKKACSGLYSERILEFIPESQKLIQNQINSVLIHWPKKILRVKFSRKFFVIERSELDILLIRLAKNSGAKIFLNYNQDKINTIILASGDFERVIGCDGALSQVRKKLRLPEPNFRLAIQGFIKKENNFHFVETWPQKNGFIWKIPRGKEIEYGIIANLKEAKVIFDKFLKKRNLNLERMNSAIVPQGLIIPYHPTIALCGDAAGLTKPWSGGGVVWSLMAANLLLKNFPDFLKYQKAVKRFFLPKIIFSKMAIKVVYFLGYNFPWIFPKNIKIESDFLI